MAVITGTNWNAYDASTMTAREIYGRTLAALAEKDERIVGITADLEKTTAIKFFADKFPERFYNVGIAEQNMMGIAAGLAKAGFIPFASTMAIFACMRAGEQVRTDMTVICPADGIETSKAVQACVDLPGPVYVRIGRGFEPPAYADDNYTYEIGKAITMHEGTDLTIITCGIGVLQAVNAAKTLAETDGLSVRVINMHTIKPIDREAIMSAVVDTRRILTVEEHNILGGLGDAVASVIAESGKGCVFKKHGMQDTFATIGYAEDLYSYYQFDANGIVDKVREMMGMEFEPDENWDDE